MGRENCTMSHWVGDICYCDYYDFGFIQCHEIKKCPDGLDDEDTEDDEYFDNDYQQQMD